MIPLRFADQIQPGTFEYTLNHVVDNELDLSVFESRYRNDYNGAPAYVLHSYSKLTEVDLKDSVTSKSIKHYYGAAEYKGIH